jgi:hypothetical protein
MNYPKRKYLPRATRALMAAAAGAVALVAAGTAYADPQGFLETVHKHTTLINTVPDNGDQNPYALVVAPVSAGTVKKDDVLVDNFNNSTNLQGTGSTIVDYHPDTKQMSVFAVIPRDLKACPGGVGLSTAMTMLKSGWVIVGSTPSNDGTTGTKGAGCLIVLDPQGKVSSTISSANINDPWGNMAVVDNGNSATLFVSNAGFGVGPATAAADGEPPVFKQATVLRLELDIPDGKPPVVKQETVVGSGFGAQADKGVFLSDRRASPSRPDQKLLYIVGRHRQPRQRDRRSDDARHQRGCRPSTDRRRPAAPPARDGHGAQRPPAGDERAEWPGRRNRPGERQADLRTLDRYRQGAIAAG